MRQAKNETMTAAHRSVSFINHRNYNKKTRLEETIRSPDIELALRTQNVTIDSKALIELPVPTLKSNTTMAANNNATMTIHTTNSIQGSNFNVLKQEEAVIRKAILSNVDNAIFLSKVALKALFQ